MEWLGAHNIGIPVNLVQQQQRCTCTIRLLDFISGVMAAFWERFRSLALV